MLGLLTTEELKYGAFMLYAHYYQREEENVGLPLGHWEFVEQPDYHAILPLVAYRLGEIATAWNYEPGLVLHHSGIERPWGRPLYYLLLGSIGTGYGLNDEYPGALAKAGGILHHEFDDGPVGHEMYEVMMLVDSDVQRRLAKADRAPKRSLWPCKQGQEVRFGDKSGIVHGCLRYGPDEWRVIVKVSDEDQELGGLFTGVKPGDLNA